MNLSTVGSTLYTGSTGTAALAYPAGYAAGDVMILLMETANEAPTLTALTSAGFVQIGTYAATGTAASAGGTRLYAFYRICDGTTLPAVTLPDSGNHTTTSITCFRGLDTASLAANLKSAAAVDAAATTSMNAVPAVTSTVRSAVFFAAANDRDSTATDGGFTGTPAGTVLSITKRADYTYNGGVGGGVALFTAEQVEQGASGGISGTWSTSNTHAYMTFSMPLIPSTYTETTKEAILKAAIGIYGPAISYDANSLGNCVNESMINYASGPVNVQPIDDTRVLVVYGTGPSLCARIGSIQANGSINYGSDLVCSSDYYGSLNVCKLSDGRFLVHYVINAASTVMTYQFITVGTSYNLSSSTPVTGLDNRDYAFRQLSDSRLFYNIRNSAPHACGICSIINDVITLLNETVISTSGTVPLSVAQLSTDKFILGVSEGGSLRTKLLTIAADTVEVTQTNNISITSDHESYEVVAVTDTRAIGFSKKSGTPYSIDVYSIVLTSPTTITSTLIGNFNVTNNGSYDSDISLYALDSTNIVLATFGDYIADSPCTIFKIKIAADYQSLTVTQRGTFTIMLPYNAAKIGSFILFGGKSHLANYRQGIMVVSFLSTTEQILHDAGFSEIAIEQIIKASLSLNTTIYWVDEGKEVLLKGLHDILSPEALIKALIATIDSSLKLSVADEIVEGTGFALGSTGILIVTEITEGSTFSLASDGKLTVVDFVEGSVDEAAPVMLMWSKYEVAHSLVVGTTLNSAMNIDNLDILGCYISPAQATAMVDGRVAVSGGTTVYAEQLNPGDYFVWDTEVPVLMYYPNIMKLDHMEFFSGFVDVFYYIVEGTGVGPGTLIETVTAEEGTYPDDGVQGGYYYRR